MKIIKLLQQRVYLIGVITAVFSLVSVVFLVVIPSNMLNNRTFVVQQNLQGLTENHLNEPLVEEDYNLFIYKNGVSTLQTHNGFVTHMDEQLEDRLVNWGQLQSTPTKLYTTEYNDADHFFYVVVIDDEYYVVSYYKIEEIQNYVDAYFNFALVIILIMYGATIVLLGLFVNSRFILGLAYYNPNTKLRTKYALMARFHRRKLSDYDLNYIVIENLSSILKSMGYKDAEILYEMIGKTLEETYLREGLYQISKNRFMALNDHKMDNSSIEDIFNQNIKDRIGKDTYRFKLRILTIEEELIARLSAEEVLSRFDFAYSYVRRTNDKTFLIDSKMLKFYEDSEYFRSSFEEALEKGWITNLYQAQFNPETNKVVGCEALSRWDDGTRLISPRHYMSMAETTGLVTEVDLHSFENACRMIQTLKHEKLLTEEFTVSINFSVITLKNTSIEDLQKIIDDYAIDAKHLAIEVKECITNDIKEVAGLLEQMTLLGIEIVIDSFRIGDTAMSVLPLLNAKSVTIDKNALPNLDEPKEVMLYESLITMANKLGLEVVAKGAETKEQIDFLNGKVHAIQGKYYSKALDKKRFIQLLSGE